MAIIDDEKQVESRSSSSSVTPFAIPRSPPPKFQSEASSSIHRSTPFSQPRHPSGYSRLTEQREHHRGAGYGFTYPALIQYIFHLLAIAAIFIFVAFTIKVIQFLSLANTLSQQTNTLIQQTIQLTNQSNALLASLLSQSQGPGGPGDQQDLGIPGTLLEMAAGVCNSQNGVGPNPACQSLTSLLSTPTVASIIASHNVEDLEASYSTYGSQSTSASTSTLYSPNNSNNVVTASFETSSPTFNQAAISFLSPSDGKLSQSVSFGLIVGAIGAVVIAFGVAGGLLYERSERTRARQERREMIEREK